MNWNDLMRNWADWFARFQTRFPHLDEGSMAYLKLDRDRFEAYVAVTHDMTVDEARAAVEHFVCSQRELVAAD